MFSDEQLVPISALQHLVFCERQCALIHVERAWEDNILTAQGQSLHQKTNKGRDESQFGNRIARSMDLVSNRLGLIGKSDVVEFCPPTGSRPVSALKKALASKEPDRFLGWQILPIEYKRGRPKTNKVWGDCDRIQVCAQSLCIEEMLGVEIPRACLFYGEHRRRLDVELDADLRSKTEAAAIRLHELVREQQLPRPVNDRRCKRCSLKSLCMPEETASPNRASRWVENQLRRLTDFNE